MNKNGNTDTNTCMDFGELGVRSTGTARLPRKRRRLNYLMQVPASRVSRKSGILPTVRKFAQATNNKEQSRLYVLDCA